MKLALLNPSLDECRNTGSILMIIALQYLPSRFVPGSNGVELKPNTEERGLFLHLLHALPCPGDQALSH